MCANGSLNPMFHNYFLFVLIQLNQFLFTSSCYRTFPYDTTTNLFLLLILKNYPSGKKYPPAVCKITNQDLAFVKNIAMLKWLEFYAAR
jgi:hypothetical protein